MKIYMFLYPIRQYFEEGMVKKRLQQFDQKGYSVKRLNEIIDARYRSKGYHVWWLLFSASAETPLLPELSQLAEQVEVHPNDTVITCGIPYATHIQQEIFLDPAFALDQLPPKPQQLVLGGFHQWNCVDNMGATAHQRKIPVVIDEDTTDHFFERTILLGEIRLEIPLNDHVLRLSEKLESFRSIEGKILLANMLKLQERPGKPWFMPLK